MKAETIRKNWQVMIIIVLAVLLVSATTWAVSENARANQQRAAGPASDADMNVNETLDEHGITLLDKEQASNNVSTASELAFLLEEEKLAHDVYQSMYDKWGSRIFTNIQGSETMHQKMVLALIESRNLPDSRTDDFGKFNDLALQKFYDELIAQGNQSVTDAYKVGVAVEERDIADLKQTLTTLDPKDTDVKDVIENLIHASENHLRAFNRQLSR
jgi:hypothetical protein